MTTTLENLIDEVYIGLSGYTMQQDRATHLTGNVTAVASTIDAPIILGLGSTDNIGKGIVEIGEELIWIDSYDRIANTANVSPFGRGYNNTTIATHTRGDKVTISPTFPRSAIKRAINDTVSAIGTVMYSVKTTSFTYNAPITTYAFNNLSINNILRVSWQEVGPTKEWRNVKHWSFDPAPNETTFGAGAQTITLGDFITPGRTVQVMYSGDSNGFTANTDDFVTATGFPLSTKDVVVLGAQYRLLAMMDPARSTMVSPQADETDAKRPFGAGQQVVKQLYALYQQRLKDEIEHQQSNFPPLVHYARR